MSLKEDWKSVGKDFGKLGSDQGKSLVRTVKKGIDAVDKWSEEEAKSHEGPKAETVTDSEETKTSEE